MLSASKLPELARSALSFFGHITATPRTVKEPPMSGQSAPMKHNTP